MADIPMDKVFGFTKEEIFHRRMGLGWTCDKISEYYGIPVDVVRKMIELVKRSRGKSAQHLKKQALGVYADLFMEVAPDCIRLYRETKNTKHLAAFRSAYEPLQSKDQNVFGGPQLTQQINVSQQSAQEPDWYQIEEQKDFYGKHSSEAHAKSDHRLFAETIAAHDGRDPAPSEIQNRLLRAEMGQNSDIPPDAYEGTWSNPQVLAGSPGPPGGEIPVGGDDPRSGQTFDLGEPPQGNPVRTIL